MTNDSAGFKTYFHAYAVRFDSLPVGFYPDITNFNESRIILVMNGTEDLFNKELQSLHIYGYSEYNRMD